MSAALDSSAVATCGLGDNTAARTGERASPDSRRLCRLRDGEVYDGTALRAADDADPASVARRGCADPAAPVHVVAIRRSRWR